MFTCPKEADEAVQPDSLAIQNCNELLTSTSATFIAIDPNAPQGRLYQWIINGGEAGEPQESLSIARTGLPNNGSTIIKRVEYSDDGGQTFQLGDECTCIAVNDEPEPDDVPEINNCGGFLTSDSATFTWTDPDKTSETIYDFWLGSAPGQRDIYDHVGANVFSGQSIAVGNLPTDGRTIYKTLRIFRNGPGTIPILVECSCTAADIPSVSLANEFNLEGTPKTPQGSWTAGTWSTITQGLEQTYTPTNMQLLSLVDDGGKCKIRQSHPPTSSGSPNVIGPFEIPPRQAIRVKQTIELMPGWSYGTTTFGGKLGQGVGGGTRRAGGQAAPDGFTMRPGWRAFGGNPSEMIMYSYAWSDTQMQGNGFGRENPTGFIPQIGVPFEYEYELVMNSPGASDGSYRVWIDGVLRIDEQNVQFMATGTPQIDWLVWSQKHGGNTPSRAPTQTSFTQTCNISWE